MYPSNSFAIQSLFPAEHGSIWVAEVAFTSDNEDIDGITVAHNARVKVRFSYPEEGSVTGLLEAAYAKAGETLALFSNRVASESFAEARSAAREVLRKKSEIDFSSLDFTPTS